MVLKTIEDAATDHGVRPREVVRGLDTLRFVAALWVAFSHGARFPIERVFLPDTALHKTLYLLNNTTFNGFAAVSMFFLISGFLIHGANVGKRNVEIVPFWTRRVVRIGIPLAAVIFAARFLGPSYVAGLNRIVWSVYAELIYYLLYPLLLPVIFRFGISKVLLASLFISIAMVTLHPEAIYLWHFRTPWTWLFCAPLWLMGCYLAEHRAPISRVSGRLPIWAYRIGAIGYCYISTILANHLGSIVIGYTWTIWFYGLFCVFWLDAEMALGTGKAPIAFLERFGLAGYSLYLTHRFALIFVQENLTDLPPFAFWIATIAAIMALTWAFYRIVEWPSHNVARSLGRPKR
jgi:peptidoglycan/LPS O-acetylase OafA/YrhL